LRPGALVHLYRVRLRSRLGAELLALAGIAIGVALVFAALVANTSLTGSVRELNEGIVGRADFQLAARSTAGFDQRLLRQVEAVPGAVAAPIAEARVNIAGPGGRRSVLLVGADPRFRDVGGRLLHGLDPLRCSFPLPCGGKEQRRPGVGLPAPLAGDLGLHEGERLTVATVTGTTRVRLAGELGRGELGALVESPAALAPLPLVQAVAGMRGRVSRVFVAAAPGRERGVEARLRQIAGNRLNLAPADEEVALFERAASPTSQSTALFSALSALVGFLFALDAMLLTLPQRRRLVADLRLTGYSPAMVVQIVLVDAVVLGLCGAALGLLLGEAASRLLFDSVPGYLSSAFAVGSQRIVTWQSAALAGAAGVIAACSAVLLPIRNLLRVGREQAASASAAGGRRLPILAGGIAGIAAIAIGLLAPALSLLALGLLLVSLLLWLHLWLRSASELFDRLCRRFRAPALILAALELRSGSARSRTLALAATGAVAVFATTAIGGARADLQRGLDGITANFVRGGDVWVAFRGPTNIFGTTPIRLKPRQVRAIEGLPGVRSLSRNRGAFLDVGRDRVWVLAPAQSQIPALLRNQVVEGSVALAGRRLRHGGWATLSAGLASELGVGVGDRVELPLPVPAGLRVAALTDNFGWPGGAIAIGAPAFARAWRSRAIGALGIEIAPRVSPVAVAAAVDSIVGGRSGLRTETAAERLRRQRAASHAGLSRLGQIAALVLISSILAMAASMAGLVWQRRPAFAVLKVHGIGEAELWRALLLEAALLLGAGCLLGGLFGLGGQVLLDRALVTITGFPLVYETAASAALGVMAMVTAAAVAVLAVPGRLAVRVPAQVGLVD
jgi:putative ABC transport system permease protein